MDSALRLCSWLLVAAVLLPAGGQQTPPAKPAEDDTPVIKVDVSLVNVFFSVRSKQGAHVPGLVQDDFEIFENGAKRPIQYFSRESNLPLTIGLLVDVSRSMENLLEEERVAAGQFFRQVLRPKDLAFLISFGSDSELLQDLTGSPTLLQQGLAKLRIVGGGPVSMTPPTLPLPGGGRGTVLYEAVWLASMEKLRAEVGRKVIVLITDGVDTGSRVKVEQAIEEAQKSDTIVYGILYEDPRYTYYQGASGEGVLKRMAQETGGRVFRVERDNTLTEIFKAIQEEVRTQYTVAFPPANSTRDGSYRKIEIRTPKNRNLRVQARRGYYATKDSQ